MASTEAPISSIPSSSSTPASCSSMARLSAVCPPSVGSSASGRSRRSTLRDALEVERLDVRAVGPARVGHDRGRVGVDEDRLVALLAQHAQGLHAGVVELAGLADDDRAGADDGDLAAGRRGAASGGPPRRRGGARRRTTPGRRGRRAARARPRGGTASTRPAGRGPAGPRRCRRRATSCVTSTAPRPVRLATAKPWFCDVTSTRPVSCSSTGWFAPRWPKRSLNVSRPSARASSWWPRQMPKSGRSSSSMTRMRATWASIAPGSPGPLASRTPSGSVARTSSARRVVRQRRSRRAPASARRRAMESLAP